MKLVNLLSPRLLLGGGSSIYLLLLLCVSVKAFSLSESYNNFLNGNNGYGRAGGVSGRSITDSAESASYETQEANDVQTIEPNRSVPAHNTYFVTATRYGEGGDSPNSPYQQEDQHQHHDQQNEMDEMSTVSEEPHELYEYPESSPPPPPFAPMPTPTMRDSEDDNSQPDFSAEDADLADGGSPLVDNIDTTTETHQPEENSVDDDEAILNDTTPSDLTASPSYSTPVIVSNELDGETGNLMMITTTPRVEQKAELFLEPIPTPMALISSNGEGSNPPLEEEFAEAFKKFGPNGRRRRIRPGGGGRRRVRMRVKKLNRGPDSEDIMDPQPFEDSASSSPVGDIATSRTARRYRSTTPSPTDIINDGTTGMSTHLPEPIGTVMTPVIRSGPKPIIISTGSIGLNKILQQQEQTPTPQQQVEKPGGGGFTEQISTYFFTPPSRISTTVEPKLQNSSSSTIEGWTNKSLEELKNQVVHPSSSSYALQTNPWDRAGADNKSNNIINNSITPLPTVPMKNEPEKSESVLRKNVQTPMEDRTYDVHNHNHNGDMDYEISSGGSRKSTTPTKLRNSFGYEGGIGNEGFFASAAPYNRFDSNPPFEGNDHHDHSHTRSHYDRTKDPFFNTNQFFKNANPFPSSSERGAQQVVEYPSTGSETEASQMQLPLFDQNGAYVSTISPISMGEQFYAPPSSTEENHNNNDYGASTHYTPTEFKGSPVDPTKRRKGGLRGGRGRGRGGSSGSSSPGSDVSNNGDNPFNTQLQRPDSFPEGGYNYDTSSSPGGSDGSNSRDYPQQPEFPSNNNEGMGSSVLHYPQDMSENMIPGGGGEYMSDGKGPVALSLQFPQGSTQEQQQQNANHNYDNEIITLQDNQNGNNNGLLPNFTGDAEYNHHNLINNNNNNEGILLPQSDYPSQGPLTHQPPPGYPNIYPVSNHPLGPHPPHPIRGHRPPPPHFFRNSAPPPPLLMHHPRFNQQRLPMSSNPLYTIASPSDQGYGGQGDGGGIGIGRPPPDFHSSSSPYVNMPMPGLSNIPPPPSEAQALNEVSPNHHFPPHTHSISDRPDYEPANPPLPPGHPMEQLNNYPGQYGGGGGEVMSNHIDDGQNPGFSYVDHHHHHFEDQLNHPPTQTNRPNQDQPGFDIMSAYYDKPPPTVGSDYDPNSPNNNKNNIHDNNGDISKVPFQYTSSDGGGLDNDISFLPNSDGKQKGGENQDNNGDTASKDNNKGNGDDKNLTAMYSETPYVLMFPQLVPEAAMIPPPPKILTKEIPVVSASSLSTMQFTPEGKPVLGPGLKAVAVHPRHQMYQVLAKAHYDKALQKYMEGRKKPPSAIYTPYGILVPMGPSAAASTNHDKYAKLESHQAHHGKAEGAKAHHHGKDPHERTLLHLLLGKKSPLGHFHLFKSASIKNGRLKNHFDFKANVDPALDLLAEKLALKLSAAKYLLTAPAKLGIQAFSKHKASYSELNPVTVDSSGSTSTRNYANSLALGSELKEMLAASQLAAYNNQKKVKGEVVDPELKADLKNMLKERLKEIMEETDYTAEMEKEHLAALASNLVQTKAYPAKFNQQSNKWSNYLPHSNSNGGLIGTIKRLFFGNPSSTANGSDRSDTDSSTTGVHPFGGSSLNYLNSVGRMGAIGGDGGSGASDPFRHSVGPPQKKVTKQLEKWLDIVLKTSDMSTSESKGPVPVWVKYPSAGRVLGKGDLLDKDGSPSHKSSLASLSLRNSLGLPNLSQKLSSSSSTIVPSNFLTSSWTPMVSSAFRSVFNYSPLKTSSSSSSSSSSGVNFKATT